jgi:hypothetical protein
MKVYLFLIVVLLGLQMISSFNDDLNDIERLEREFNEILMEKKDAENFLVKRKFIHIDPFHSKTWEVKREVRERYEEKCEHIIPTKR